MVSPICKREIHIHPNSLYITLTICFSPPEPLLYVVANVEEHASEYHGMLPYSVALLMDRV